MKKGACFLKKSRKKTEYMLPFAVVLYYNSLSVVEVQRPTHSDLKKECTEYEPHGWYCFHGRPRTYYPSG